MDDEDELGIEELEELEDSDRHQQPSIISIITINTAASLYGAGTGFVVMNSLVATAPVPTATANDTFFLLVGSAVAAVGLFNLNRDHLLHLAHLLANREDSLARSLLRSICAYDQLPVHLSVFNTTLKAAGAIAEGCIAFSVTKQLLNHAPSIVLPLGIVLAVASFFGFPLVEGGALTKALKGEFNFVDSSRANATIVIDTTVLKKIFFPELALVAAIQRYEDKKAFGSVEAGQQNCEAVEIELPSTLRILSVNVITFLGSVAMGLLAFLDITTLLPNTYGYVMGVIIAMFYLLADIALRGNEAKRRLYQLPSADKLSDREAMRHAPFATAFAIIQSLLLALIPFVVMLELFDFGEHDVSAQEVPILQLVVAAVFAIPKLITAFLVEGMGIVHNFTHQDGGPLFSSLFNIAQFVAPVICVSLYEVWQDNYSLVGMTTAYAMASGANVILSATRYGILKLADKEVLRQFHSVKAVIGWVLANTSAPLAGAIIQALLQYVFKREQYAALAGFSFSGLSCVLARLYANKNALFYTKEPAHAARPQETIYSTLEFTK